MKTLAALALPFLLFIALPAPARVLEGVNLPETVSLAGEKQPLVLNGAGLRTKYLFKIYVGALYTAQPVTQAGRVLDAATPRVMRMQFLRALRADQMATGWKEGFAANQSDERMQALAARLAQFNQLMPDVKVNDVLQINLRPNGDTHILLNNQPRGAVPGADFQRALLEVWLGRSPADRSLKAALLGAK
jgi:hypothetical protein